MSHRNQEARARANCLQGQFYGRYLDFRKDPADIMKQFFPSADGSDAWRDPCGGTLLHWCLLLGCGVEGARSEDHRGVAMYIIDHASLEVLDLQFDRSLPEVVTHVGNGVFVPSGVHRRYPYKALWYDGEAALHIAVAKGDVEIVQDLVARKVDFKLRAYGSFFAPGREQPSMYFGEYALSFAASCGLDNIALLLISAYPHALEQRDSFGNTAFHLAILHRRMRTYRLLVTESGMLFDEVAKIRGARGLTPLAMAAFVPPRGDDDDSDDDDDTQEKLESLLARYTGNGVGGTENEPDEDGGSMFAQVLNTTRQVAWGFSSVTAYTMSLEQIDTLILKGTARSVQDVAHLVRVGRETPSKRPSSHQIHSPKREMWKDPEAQSMTPPASDTASGSLGQRRSSTVSRLSDRVVRYVGEKMGVVSPDQAQLDDLDALGAHSAGRSFEVVENTAYRSILSLTMNFGLYHMVDEDVIMRLLDAKWRIVRWPYYIGMVFQGVHVGVLTTFTIYNHPSMVGGHDIARDILRVFSLLLAILGLLPFAYDVAKGVQFHNALTNNMRRNKVEGDACPRALKDGSAWMVYRELETLATPLAMNGDSELTLWDAFPMSGFDLFTLLGFSLLMLSQLMDAGIDYPREDASENATVTAAANTTAGGTRYRTPHYLVVLGMATMAYWFSTFTFAPIHHRLGLVVTMMTRTLYRDVFPYVIVFVVLLGGTTVAVYCLMTEGFSVAIVADILTQNFFPTADTQMRLKNGGPGEEGPDQGVGAQRQGYMIYLYIVILLFTLITSLLMLNLFIAALTSTYEEVLGHADQESRLQWGRDVLQIERRLLSIPIVCERLRVNHGDRGEHTFLSILTNRSVNKNAVSIRQRLARRKLAASLSAVSLVNLAVKQVTQRQQPQPFPAVAVGGVGDRCRHSGFRGSPSPEHKHAKNASSARAAVFAAAAKDASRAMNQAGLRVNDASPPPTPRSRKAGSLDLGEVALSVGEASPRTHRGMASSGLMSPIGGGGGAEPAEAGTGSTAAVATAAAAQPPVASPPPDTAAAAAAAFTTLGVPQPLLPAATEPPIPVPSPPPSGGPVPGPSTPTPATPAGAGPAGATPVKQGGLAQPLRPPSNAGSTAGTAAFPALLRATCAACGRRLEFSTTRYPVKVQCFDPACKHVTRVEAPR